MVLLLLTPCKSCLDFLALILKLLWPLRLSIFLVWIFFNSLSPVSTEQRRPVSPHAPLRGGRPQADDDDDAHEDDDDEDEGEDGVNDDDNHDDNDDDDDDNHDDITMTATTMVLTTNDDHER